ncbi:MAG: chloride channel protein [Bacteroidia bacterium]|nr:chloride channel protein [Bacteroidia bacterium]
MDQPTLFGKFLIWRLKHIPQRQFVLILSFVIGALGGMAAIILKNTVYYTYHFLTTGFDVGAANILYLACPLSGIFLTVIFVNKIIRDNISHGIMRILYAISRKESVIKPHNTYSSLVSSTLTVGFGGSVGLEAPILLTGASIGSNIGQLVRLNYKTRTLFIGCGVAGALAGIFKAPIAAVIFCLEVLMLDLTTWSVIPLLISSVTGAVLANFLLGKEVLFYFAVKTPFIPSNIHYYILLGIITGLFSIYFTRITMYVEDIFAKIRNQYYRLITGGIILGLLIFIFPPLFGEGYESMKSILSGNVQELTENSFFHSLKDNYWFFLFFLLLILFFKVIAMSTTTGSGGIGGIFAPALFMGGITGFIISRLINNISFIHVSESNFTLAGMAGFISGVIYAPLTAIFLIAEITGGYELFIPLIVTSTISYSIVRYFDKHSIYTKRLAERGELITHHKDKAVLSLLKLKKEIEHDFISINPNATLKELVNAVSKSHRNVFPVVDEKNGFLGVVLLDNIRHVIFNKELYDTSFVHEYMMTPQHIVSLDDSMETVMKKFEESGYWNMPVVNSEGKYIGFVSKSKIFSAYRKILIDFSDD